MISNPTNPTIRQIRKLRKRRDRERRRMMLVEGHRSIGVALERERTVVQLVHTRAGAVRRRVLLKQARTAGATLLEVTPEVMASLTSLETAPDVLGVTAMREVSLAEAVGRLGLGVVLAAVGDPATAGSILASCAAAGGAAAIATSHTTDLFAPKPVRSGAGAHFALAISSNVSPAECAAALRAAGVRIVVVDASGEDPAELDLSEPLAVVVGEEGAIPEELREAAIGVAGVGAGILRPSTAIEAAVVLFEAARRRRTGTRGGRRQNHG